MKELLVLSLVLLLFTSRSHGMNDEANVDENNWVGFKYNQVTDVNGNVINNAGNADNNLKFAGYNANADAADDMCDSVKYIVPDDVLVSDPDKEEPSLHSTSTTKLKKQKSPSNKKKNRSSKNQPKKRRFNNRAKSRKQKNQAKQKKKKAKKDRQRHEQQMMEKERKRLPIVTSNHGNNMEDMINSLKNLVRDQGLNVEVANPDGVEF
eukprot:64015_1